MKKVVLKETQEVSIDQITDESIVGIEYSNGEKCYIIIVDNLFACIAPFKINNNSYYTKGSKREYAEYSIKHSEAKVYLFYTKEEIINWLKS